VLRPHDGIRAVLETESRVLVRIDPLDNEFSLPALPDAINTSPVDDDPCRAAGQVGRHRSRTASWTIRMARPALGQILWACAEVCFAVSARDVVNSECDHGRS